MFRKVMQMIQDYAEKKLLDEVFATYLDVQDAAAEMAQVLPCPRCGKLTMKIVQEVGLVTSVREMDEFYSKQPSALKDFYERMKSYVPSAFLTAFMAIPFPREAKELLFIVQKPKGEENA